MNILIIGSGGREHALAWKAAQSEKVDQIYVAPGNAGTAKEKNVTNVNIDVSDIETLCQFAQEQEIHLTIIGPEAPLALGIVDRFKQEGLRCFGPTQAASQLESSKTFSKEFMLRHNIPTAKHSNFTDVNAAKAYVKKLGTPIVIKSDGLAAGKGVVVAHTQYEAFVAIESMLAENTPELIRNRIVVEEFLKGEEASFIVMVDGKNILPLATSQDHKARDNGDIGPNTGGMGAYSPATVITPVLYDKIIKEVIEPTVHGIASEGHRYIGFLYAGLMIMPNNDIKVLEFNCRLGDPEAQAILLRLQSDLISLCNAALDQKLNTIEAKWDPRTALGVVLTAQGYPEKYKKGEVIKGLPLTSQTVKVFHSGTVEIDGEIVTAGGRVLCVTALGETTNAAAKQAYSAVNKIRWEGMHYRTDIGYKAIQREQNE